MYRKLLLSVLALLGTATLHAQTSYSHTLNEMWSINSRQPFTYPATPYTTGGATMSFQWVVCNSGSGTPSIEVRIKTGANSHHVILYEQNALWGNCTFQARTVSIPADVFRAALDFGAGSIHGDVDLDDACPAGMGCSFYNDPGFRNATLSYTTSSADFNAVDADVCSGGIVQFTDASINSPSTHSWSFPGGNPATSTLPSPAVQYATPGQYDVTLTVLTSAGESSTTRTSFVTVHDLPPANAGADQYICEESSVDLQANGGVGYLWSPATGLSSTTIPNPTANPESTTTYTVLVSSAGGCEAADQVVVNVVPPPVPVVDAPASLCGSDTLTLNASGATFYTWSPNLYISSTSGSSVDVWPSADQSWSVTGTDAHGCTGVASVSIAVVPPATIPQISWTDMALHSSEATTYQWYLNGEAIPGAEGPTWVPQSNGSYTVSISDTNGCQASSAPFAFNSMGIRTASAGNVRAYPVPANGSLFLEGVEAGTPFRLLDASGRVVTSGSSSGPHHILHVGKLSAGSYILDLGNAHPRLRVVLERP